MVVNEFEMFGYIVFLYHVTWPVNYLTPICLYLTLDIWHWYLTCYHLTPDIWHLTIDMLSLGTDTLDLMLWHHTGYYYTWHLYYIAYSWLSLLWGLDMIYYTTTIWYSWTRVSPVLMSPVLLLLLRARSYQRPAKHAAWCQDDEDVSYDHVSVRWILNGTKCRVK